MQTSISRAVGGGDGGEIVGGIRIGMTTDGAITPMEFQVSGVMWTVDGEVLMPAICGVDTLGTIREFHISNFSRDMGVVVDSKAVSNVLVKVGNVAGSNVLVKVDNVAGSNVVVSVAVNAQQHAHNNVVSKKPVN